MSTLTKPAAFTSPIPFVTERIGAAAIYCSDGRYGAIMDDFLQETLLMPHYDRVAIPGGAASLAGHLLAMRERSALERQIKFLVESHQLTRIVMIAHQDCGFYKRNVHPAKFKRQSLRDLQAADLAAAARFLLDFNRELEVSAYFARRDEDQVTFEPVPL